MDNVCGPHRVVPPPQSLELHREEGRGEEVGSQPEAPSVNFSSNSRRTIRPQGGGLRAVIYRHIFRQQDTNLVAEQTTCLNSNEKINGSVFC